jgi:hypothetical protein
MRKETAVDKNTRDKDAIKDPTPMDPTTKEARVGTPAANNERACYAAKTLVAEVNELFPETPFEYSNHDGRNTALDVTFDLNGMDNDAALDLHHVLGLIDSDARVAGVIVEDEAVLVSFRSSPRTQDLRDPFGLADALMVLSGEPDEYSIDEDEEGSL